MTPSLILACLWAVAVNVLAVLPGRDERAALSEAREDWGARHQPGYHTGWSGRAYVPVS